MAISRTALGTAVNNKSGGSFTISVAAGNVQVNDWIFVLVASDDSVTPSDPVYKYDGTNVGIAPSIMSLIASANFTNNVLCGLYGARATHASQSGATIVGDLGSGAQAAVAIAVSGLSTSPTDKVASNATGTGLTATSNTTATTTQDNEIVIGCIGWEGPNGDDTGTWSNSFTAGQRIGTTGGSATSNVTIQEGYRIVSATGTFTAEVVRTTNSRDWAACVATFKAAAEGTPIDQAVSSTNSSNWLDDLSFIPGIGLNFSDNVTFSDALAALFNYLLNYSDQLSLSDSALINLEHRFNFSDVISQTDELLQLLIGILNQASSEAFGNFWSDSVDTLYGFGKSASDSLDAWLDTNFINLAYLIEKADQLNISDEIKSQLNHLLNLADQISQSDSLNLQLAYLVNFIDLLIQSDDLTILLGNILEFADSFSQSDNSNLLFGLSSLYEDQLILSDSFNQWLNKLLVFNDSLNFNDSISNILHHLKVFNDQLSQSDSLKAELHHRLQIIGDFLQFLDSIEFNISQSGGNLTQLFADVFNFNDSFSTSLKVFIAGIFTFGDIVERIRQTIDNPVYFTTDDIAESVQDGYDEIIATTGSILKAAIIPFQEKLIYYDFKSLIGDYVSLVAIYNNVTKRWMTPISYRNLDELCNDWELIEGNPEWFSVISHRYVVIHPRVSVNNYGNMYVFYKASANALTDDNTIRFNNDFIAALEEYAAMDLLEQQQEFTKASIHFKNYIQLVNQLEIWVKNQRESDRLPALK